MTEVAVLTPDPADPSYAGQWPGVLDHLAAALATAGIKARPTPWTDHVESAHGLMDFPLVLPLIVWGYHHDHERWIQACATWAEADAPLANPAEVLRWNSDKRYLARLAEKGVAIPPTIWTDHASPAVVEAAFAAIGAEQLIVKPTVSGGAWRTLKVAAGDLLEEVLTDAPEGGAMIQPFLPTIRTEGETSLLFFGGELSHVVNKRPAHADEFRIQVQYGGRYQRLDQAPEGALDLAERTLAAIEEPLLYARIDMVPDENGQWLLMEAELIEPDFYLSAAPEAGARFGRAVADRLGL
ncbi:ATP-grasp domain-containing protein [Brevundimonas sp.]|uniref:ATP-grasp domain-containing protein n=1 Tax=Brevundimonas sp. TaxID=1871086 RepID=UPI003D6D854C